MNSSRIMFRSLGRRAALTLLEMMVAVTLLALIMVGLLAMFNQTQKALHAVNAQSDVFENARGAVQMVGRDLAEIASFNEPGVTNLHSAETPFVGLDVTLPRVPTDLIISNRFHEAFWLTRANDDWIAIGYYVDGAAASFGTLHRYSLKGRENELRDLRFWKTFFTNQAHRVSDGIVNFRLQAVFPETNIVGGVPVVNYVSSDRFDFTSNALPAYVDMEIGVLEPSALKQVQSITSDPGFDQKAVDSFLRAQVGKIHYFRQRVPIRNFLNPYRSNEVP
jgi:hypothetical protein